MNLPDSIKSITNEVQADKFIPDTHKTYVDINEIIFLIRQKITPEQSKYFEEGLVYYKSSANEKSIIAGFLSLYADIVIKEIRETTIDKKSEIIDHLSQNIKTISQLFDQQYDLLKLLNNNNKVIDASKLSYIMLGYAIETIKKIQNTKS